MHIKSKSQTTIDISYVLNNPLLLPTHYMNNAKIKPIHPGEILMEDFLEPLGVSQYKLAKNISVPARRINEIVHGERGISADTALRLALFFNTTPQFWLNLQSHYDLEIEKDRLANKLNAEVTSLAFA